MLKYILHSYYKPCAGLIKNEILPGIFDVASLKKCIELWSSRWKPGYQENVAQDEDAWQAKKNHIKTLQAI